MDPNALLALLNGQNDPQALAQALRGQRAMGLLGQLSGDKVLSPLGQNLGRGADTQMDNARETQGARLRAALEAQKAAAEEAKMKADQDFRRRQLEQGDARIALDREELSFRKGEAGKPKPAKPADPDDLRKEFQGQQPYKDFNQVSAAYKKIQSTSDTGAGDMSLIFGYMKLLDPNSTVREGEYATAANAGNIPDKVVSIYNKAISGEKLAPEVRKQFRAEAEKVYGAQKSEYDRIAKNYVRLAKERGLNPGDVVFGYEEPTAPNAVPMPAHGQAADPAAALRAKYGL